MKTRLEGCRRSVLCSILVTVICIVLAGGNDSLLAESQSGRPLAKIGAILPLTGEMAAIGNAMRQGMELALAEGGSEHFQLFIEDDLSLNRIAAVGATKKLIEVKQVSALLNCYTNTISAIGPLLNRAKTVGMVVWDSNQSIARMGEYVFGFGYSTEFAGEDMAGFAKDELAVNRVGVISFHDEWSEVISEAFTKRFAALGGKVVFHEKVTPAETDFRALITRAISEKVDALYAPLAPLAAVSWLKQSREQRFAGSLLTGDGFSHNEVVQAGAQNAEGVYLTQLWVADENFAGRYKKMFDGDTSGLNLGFVALGYDSLKCFEEHKRAIEAGGSTFSSATLRKSMLALPCKGIAGETRFDNQRLSGRREGIFKVVNGAFVAVK